MTSVLNLDFKSHSRPTNAAENFDAGNKNIIVSKR